MNRQVKYNLSIVSGVLAVLVFYFISMRYAFSFLILWMFFRRDETDFSKSNPDSAINTKAFISFFLIYEFLFLITVSIYSWEPYIFTRHFYELTAEAETRIFMTLFFLPLLPHYFKYEYGKFLEINNLNTA